MKSRLLVLTLTIFIFSSCESSNPKESNHNNFDFEKVDSFGKPLGWQIGFSEQFAKGYLTTQDSVIKHSGKFSIKLHFVEKTPSLGICYMVIPSKYKGSKIKLTGYIKTESVTGGYAGLYLKLNGEDGLMGRDMMERTGLRGTNDWQKVSISLPFSSGVEVISVGVVLSGKGICWADDLSLEIDGNDFVNAPSKDLAEESLCYDSSKFKISSQNIQSEPLETLAQVWAFMKYHHPDVTQGKYNWDLELLRILPEIMTEKNKGEWQKKLSNWIERFKINKLNDSNYPIDVNRNALYPDYGDLFKNGFLSSENQELLKSCFSYSNKRYPSYYVDSAIGGAATMRHEKLYASTPYPHLGLRLLALFRYWAFVQYFYPDRNLIDYPWTTVLEKFIPQFSNAKNETDYLLACQNLITRIHDSHARIFNNNLSLENYLGNFYPNFRTNIVEDKLVVGDFIDSSSQQQSGISKGDIIIEIDGIATQTYIERFFSLISASNKSAFNRDLVSLILRGNSNSLKLTVVHNGILITKQFERFNSYEHFQFFEPKIGSSNSHFFTKNNNKIYYLNAAKLTSNDIDSIKNSTDLSGIILDMRSNISFGHLKELFDLLRPGKEPFVLNSSCDIRFPGLFSYHYPKEYLDWGSTGSSIFKGRLVIIANENTQSSGEYVTMAFQTVKSAVTVGNTTAGADGNITIFNLPGFVTTGFSGLGVYYPNKSVTQGVGVKIDVIIKPTLKGVKEGIDEQFEGAVNILSTTK